MKIIIIFLVSFSSIFASDEYSFLNRRGQVQSEKLNQYITKVEPFIKRYPPRFKSPIHKEELINSALLVKESLSTIEFNKIANANVALSIGYTYSMFHNIDLGTADLAIKYFNLSLSISPENRRANYLFGMFLMSTKKYIFESEPYLSKAYELGEIDALYTLGLLYIHKGNNAQGLDVLMKYSKEFPKNLHVKKVIKSIQGKTLKFHKL